MPKRLPQVCVCYLLRTDADGPTRVLLGRKKPGLGVGKQVGPVRLESMWDDARHWLPAVLAGGWVRRRFTVAADLDTVLMEHRARLLIRSG